MVGPQVEISGRDSPHTPLRLGREGCSLVIAGGRHDDLVPVFVDGASGGGSQLRLFFGLFLDLCNLLPLLGGCADLHPQNDVTDLRLSQGGYIHTARTKRRYTCHQEAQVEM